MTDDNEDEIGKRTAAETVAGMDPSERAEEGPVLPPDEIRAVLEALIFASPQPLTPREIGKVLGGVPKEAWQAAVTEIDRKSTRLNSSHRLTSRMPSSA